MITLIVDSFKHLSPLALDVLSHQLLTAVGGGSTPPTGRAKLKDDGLNASGWMAALETFIGVFYRKCHKVELRGILRYVVERLQNNSGKKRNVKLYSLKVNSHRSPLFEFLLP